ncbi:MAG: hypothetical protein WD470_01235 [Rhodospirillaceae bacterium]
MSGAHKIPRRPASTAAFGLFAAMLFLWTQIATAGHAAEFGSAPHSHDGVPCALHWSGDAPSLPVPDAAAAAPPAVLLHPADTIRDIAPHRAVRRYAIRAPPPALS